MEIAKALENFRGKSGPRLNCAQSIAAAFGEDPSIFESHGSGKAPEGWCGAAYAAAVLSQNAKVVEQTFLEAAGTITCAGIRQARAMSCASCVETSARLVQQARTPKTP